MVALQNTEVYSYINTFDSAILGDGGEGSTHTCSGHKWNSLERGLACIVGDQVLPVTNCVGKCVCVKALSTSELSFCTHHQVHFNATTPSPSSI